jgi:DNA replication protein DnaC
MIITDLDSPGGRDIKCVGCGEIMHDVQPFWTGRSWIYASVHEECKQKSYDLKVVSKKVIPERFRSFDEFQFRDTEAMRIAQAFDLDVGYKTLAIIGSPGTGKSRLMWHVLGRFFKEVQRLTLKDRWVEYWIFSDLVIEPERGELAKVKSCQFCFIDDIGVTKGTQTRERVRLQDVIHARVQKGQWTFLTIDDPEFDPGFKDLFRERAVEVYVE